MLRLSPPLTAFLLALAGPPCPCPAADFGLPPPGQTVVFVADGSGNLHGTCDSLTRVAADCGAPLHVERCAWSHGTGRVFQDLHGRGHQREQGQALASVVAAHRHAHPCDRICLVGHSAGAAVVLAAAEALPAGTVDRILLLAPAVSPHYDLCAALECSCEGIDSFHSHHDGISLALAAVGTADGAWTHAAGGRGFHPPACPEHAAAYCNLRQHPWTRDMTGTGHGGHFGWTRCDFLRGHVLPLLLGPPHCAEPAAAPAPPAAPIISN